MCMYRNKITGINYMFYDRKLGQKLNNDIYNMRLYVTAQNNFVITKLLTNLFIFALTFYTHRHNQIQVIWFERTRLTCILAF